MIPVTDGIRVRIIYQLVQRRSRPDDGGAGTLLCRVRQFETADLALADALDVVVDSCWANQVGLYATDLADIDLMAVDHMGDEIHELPRMRERRGRPP
jgi:hypothetical protein